MFGYFVCYFMCRIMKENKNMNSHENWIFFFPILFLPMIFYPPLLLFLLQAHKEEKEQILVSREDLG